MRKYDIRKAAKRRKGAVVKLPGIEESAGVKAAYLKALRRLLRGIKSLAISATGQSDLNEIALVASQLTEVAENTVSRILDLEAVRHTDTFIAGAKRVLGVDLRSVVTQEDLRDYLRLANARNASLIKSLSDDTVKRVEQAVLNNMIEGNSRETLRKTLTEQFGIADNRAKLIAQDQMAKLNADLNEARHTQAGIKEYEWLTSKDERVRPRHKALSGKVYRYGEPTGAEDGAAPGKAVRCRCIAVAVIQY